MTFEKYSGDDGLFFRARLPDGRKGHFMRSEKAAARSLLRKLVADDSLVNMLVWRRDESAPPGGEVVESPTSRS